MNGSSVHGTPYQAVPNFGWMQNCYIAFLMAISAKILGEEVIPRANFLAHEVIDGKTSERSGKI
jgi:hypothetical protein